ncbi:MAG TPA: hypothetical protein VL357_02850 [Rariglobus sp.]|nr:hypothetical protein [Rariglobus sp.]
MTLLARPLGFAAVDAHTDLVFAVFRGFVPPTELHRHRSSLNLEAAVFASGNGDGLVAALDWCGDRGVRRLLNPLFIALFFTGCASLRADFSDDLARIHLESIGGRQQLLALKSLKATGVTKIGGEELHFVMWAARPNLIRTETTSNGRVLTQGYDGANPPWLVDSKNGLVHVMGAVAARAFSADADFDDPLVLRGGRQISLDYAGETEIDGKPVFKLIVIENFTETSFIYLDRFTYFLIRHEVVKSGPRGPEIVATDYSDFSPVNGIMLAHRITEKAGGRVRYETILDQIDANPVITPGLFSKPTITVKP